MAAKFMAERQFKSFVEFWPYYLGEHSKPATRLLHCIGTISAIALVVAFVAIGKWWLFPLAFVPGYAFAWISHFLSRRIGQLLLLIRCGHSWVIGKCWR